MFALRAAALMLCLAVAPAAAAAVSDPPAAAEPSAAQKAAAEALGRVDASRLFGDKDYAEQVLAQIALLRPLAARDATLAYALDQLSVFALAALERRDEAWAMSRGLFESKRAQAVDHGTAVWLAWLRGQPVDGLAALEAAAAALRTDEERRAMFEVMDDAAVYSIGQHFHQEDKDKDRQFRLSEALVALGWPGPHLVGRLDAHRRDAAQGRLDRGDLPGARSLAARIVSPSALLPLLVMRKADPLFAGANPTAAMRSAIDRYEKASASALAAAPQDPRVVVERAMFLRAVGRDKDAWKLLEPHVSDFAKVREAGEDAFWLVNEAAYALIGSGRTGEAAALMEKLVALGLEDHPELISMAINRLAILNSIGRHEEGTRLALDLAEKGGDYASLYGHMWIWSEAACGLAAGGDAAAAAPWLAKLAEKSDDNAAAHMRALLCLDRLDEAEALLIRRLESDNAEQALVAIQDYTLSPAFQTPRGKAMEKKLASVVGRPAVQAAAAKVGRIVRVPLSRVYWGDF